MLIGFWVQQSSMRAGADGKSYVLWLRGWDSHKEAPCGKKASDRFMGNWLDQAVGYWNQALLFSLDSYYIG